MQYEQGKFVDRTGADMAMQGRGDSVDLQNCADGEIFKEMKEISNSDLTKHPSGHSPSETAFDIDMCDSVDDLGTFFKQVHKFLGLFYFKQLPFFNFLHGQINFTEKSIFKTVIFIVVLIFK